MLQIKILRLTYPRCRTCLARSVLTRITRIEVFSEESYVVDNTYRHERSGRIT